jgi:hypothetical protein
LTILPRTEVALSSVVIMAREEMREIKVQAEPVRHTHGRFICCHEWGRDKVGQTARATSSAREADPRREDAPFRHDLGPSRLRSVGQRPSALARVV